MSLLLKTIFVPSYISLISLQIKRTVDLETILNNNWVIQLLRFIGTVLLIYV